MEGDSLLNNPEAVFTKLITGIFTLAKGILSTKGSPKMLNRQWHFVSLPKTQGEKCLSF
jgi:hypothetical protein